ncbi:MAG TPA: phosphoglycerate kinase [Candidatus Nanoarchaeia archaeon]|nr:phosphoglycerate kinase [Candidatus Nanoarchaeia archaeon]
MQKFFTLNDLNVKGKRVLVRVDFNVPLDKITGEITDDKRIKETLPTIKFLIDRNAKIILCSHLGRPDGKVVENLRMDKIAHRLGQLLNKKVNKLNDCVGDYVKEEVMKMKDGDVVLLENLRFHPDEEENDESFSRQLADLAELYVNDAFGTCHRAHASTYGATKYLKSAAGFLVEKEIRIMGRSMENPDRPLIGILGGAKLGDEKFSDKINIIENLLLKVDKVLLGGAIIFTFFKAQGKNVGTSKMQGQFIDMAKRLLKNNKIILPVDVVIADKFDANADSKTVDVNNISDGWMGLDIGPKTIKNYKQILKDAKTVVWNGPMGVFEFDKFSIGTKELAKFLTTLNATTIIGGGDSAAAVEKFGYAQKLTHVSTGGGASLEFLEGKKLPGILALEQSYKKFK